MATIYDIDYAKFGENMLPPDKRKDANNAFVKVLLSPLATIRDLFFSKYKDGANDLPEYSALTTYAKYDLVKYNRQVYISLADGNTAAPTDAINWRQVQDNFVGVLRRCSYAGSCIVLTYALNEFFETTFRQPPLVSDIYFQTNSKGIEVFTVGITEDESSDVYLNTSSAFVVNAYSFAEFFNFTVLIPVAVYNALDADAANREKIFRNYCDKYVPAGIIYDIQTY